MLFFGKFELSGKKETVSKPIFTFSQFIRDETYNVITISFADLDLSIFVRSGQKLYNLACLKDRNTIYLVKKLYSDEASGKINKDVKIVSLEDSFMLKNKIINNIKPNQKLEGIILKYEPLKSILLIRSDVVGEVRIFYAFQKGILFFSNSLDILRNYLPQSLSVNKLAIISYACFNYIPSPLTIFQSIRRLPVGFAIEIKKGIIEIKETATKEWINAISDLNYANKNDGFIISSILEENLNNIIKDINTEIRFALAFSGGIDSTLNLTLLKKLGYRELNVFTLRYLDVTSYDESSFARKVARAMGASYNEICVDMNSLESFINEILGKLEQPYANSSLIGCSILGKHVKELGYELLITGDGGDELFGGYDKYRALELERWISPFKKFLSLGTNIIHYEDRASRLGEIFRQYKKLVDMLGKKDNKLLLYLSVLNRIEDVSKLVNMQNEDLNEIEDLANMIYQKAILLTSDQINRYLYFDLYFELPYDQAEKLYNIQKICRIYFESPFLKKNIISASFLIRGEKKVSVFLNKIILRNILEGMIPKHLIKKKKMGFGFPIGEWLRMKNNVYINEYINRISLKSSIFNYNEVKKILADHVAFRRDNSWLLWMIIVFENWRKRYHINF